MKDRHNLEIVQDFAGRSPEFIIHVKVAQYGRDIVRKFEFFTLEAAKAYRAGSLDGEGVIKNRQGEEIK